MNWLNILYYVISALIGIVATGVPLVINRKAKIDARTLNVLRAMAQFFVEGAEKSFEGFDKVMKEQGSSAGAMKKDAVFTKLQAYALQNGYKFDADYWNEEIDKIVAFTREVNAKTVG